MSARADLTYQNGLNKMWTRNTKYDFYFPEFAHLGEQPIKLQQDLVKHDKLPRYYQKILKEKIDLEQNPESWQSNRLTNRLKKLEPIKGHLHYQYKERIEELQPKTYTNHEHLAILEISDAQTSQHSEREISSIDLKEQQQKKEYLRELIRRQ